MSAPGLPYAWYGDDFTGAADTLATVASAGLRAGLFLGVPSAAQRERLGPLDALGIAGTARALNPTAMRSEIAPVGDYLAAQAPAITHYKCCSTFDSAIGPMPCACRWRRRSASVIGVTGWQRIVGWRSMRTTSPPCPAAANSWPKAQ